MTEFTKNFEDSWLCEELNKSRNFGPAMHKFGTYIGAAFNYIDQNLLGGKIPIPLTDDTPDHATLKTTEESPTIEYPRPDGKISFDKPSSVFLSSTNHEEDQPAHLTLINADTPSAPTSKWNKPAPTLLPCRCV